MILKKWKKEKTKNKLNSKTVDRTPINVSTMGDDDAPNTSPNEIHVGGNHLYYEEEKTNGISYADFMKKVEWGEVRMEKIQNILFTCSFIENNYLAFESSVEAWQSLKWGDYSKPVVARRFCRLMKLNFDKVIDENAVRVTQ